MELIYQILTTLALLFGILAGELLTYRAFGRPKAKILIIDIFIFVLVLVGIFNFISYSQYNIIWYGINFFIGLATMVVTRSLEAAFGLTETPIKKDKLVFNILRTLYGYGLEKEEVKKILAKSGISDPKIDNLLDKEVPPYLSKLVKIEKDIEYIKRHLKKRK